MIIPEEGVIAPVSNSLTPYTGTWTKTEAAHLLRRTVFGPTFQQIQQAVSSGMNATIAQLMTLPAVTQPLTYSPDEAVAAQGTTWVGKPLPASNPVVTDQARQASLMGWMIERINQPGQTSIQEKMCLFWENHFGVEQTFDARATYNLHHKFRTSCLGDFKQLVKDVTIDPNMLVFLNGTSNNKFSPNENYARELLELFTVGKGPQVGEGDYTNYTEQDVAAGAKILTGWVIKGFQSSTDNDTSSYYYPLFHDTSTKTLSARFGGVTVPNGAGIEYANYINIIFQQPKMGKFICRKLYRWFVNYDLTPQVEATVIEDMCTTLEANNFQIQPVLEELLKSQHFYDVAVRGAIIKNPMEYMFSLFNSTHSKPNHNLIANYKLNLNIYYLCTILGMDYLRPPSVGGWTSYYQAPSYSKLWANSSYIKLRFDLAAYLTVFEGLEEDGFKFKVDALTFLNGLSAPSSAPDVIEDMTTVFCPKGLTVMQKAVLKSVLTYGQPDFEWTIQYNEYMADPTNDSVSVPVRQRVEFAIYSFFQMPEVQTI